MDGLSTTAFYRNALQDYTMEQLRYKSSVGVWSIGEMYDHLIETDLDYLVCAEKCAELSKEVLEGKTEAGEEAFRTGIFSKTKIKLPDTPQFTPRQPESIEEIYAGLDRLTEKLIEWREKVDAVNPNYKLWHGMLGWLNAREWYELVSIHNRHHFRQKEELDQKLQQTK